MRTIRASEIGTFIYCRLAWWQRLQGVEPANRGELAAGTAFHQQHARRVASARLLTLLGVLLLLAALALLGVWLAGWVS